MLDRLVRAGLRGWIALRAGHVVGGRVRTAAGGQLSLLSLTEELSAVGHWTLDVASQAVHSSPEIYRTQGRDPVLGPPALSEAIHAYQPQDRERVAKAVATAMERGEGFSFGGRIECDSTPGQGTTFTVLLSPMTSCATDAAELARQPIGAHVAGRVVIIDDEAALLSSVARFLAPQCDVRTFEDPLEGLTYLLSGAPVDLVLCDLMMPHPSGMDLFHAVEAQRPGLTERFVFITAGTTHADVQAFFASARNERLEKPFDLGELRQLVRRRLAPPRSGQCRLSVDGSRTPSRSWPAV